ncbi:hypothetical protein DL769_009208 [Monosporascus sp. CRB-8-3]|nr:hypothetical protein DL769_009208 [Monosporascus sp. CRB-8-3]
MYKKPISNVKAAIANMTMEWGALLGLSPIDSILETWLRAKATASAVLGDSVATNQFSHQITDQLIQDQLTAGLGTPYAKSLLSLDIVPVLFWAKLCQDCDASPQVGSQEYQDQQGISSQLHRRESIRLRKQHQEYPRLLCLNKQQKGLRIGKFFLTLEPIRFLLAAAFVLVWGRMGSTNAKSYLGSPEVVAASALQGKIDGPGRYQKPEGVEKPMVGEGTGQFEQDKARSIEDALEKVISEANGMDLGAEQIEASVETSEGEETLTDILPSFPEKKQDNITVEKMAEVVMENFDPNFSDIAKAGDVLVGGYNFGCGSSREQAATAILAKKIPLVVSGSFGNTFSRNGINNALMLVEVARLVQRLRETFKTVEGEEKVLTRRTGWKFLWDLRSKVTVTEGKGGQTWSQKVGELPPNVH